MAAFLLHWRDRVGEPRSAPRRVLVAILLAFIGAGLIGTYSYAQNYYQHRGFATLPRLARATGGRLVTVGFYSHALGKETDYLVYLPAAYQPGKSLPAYYLLHGMPGRPLAFTVIGNIEVRLDNLIALGKVKPMILVFPDGRIDGNQLTDSEWANTPSGRYDSYVTDVVQDVDQRFGAIPNRDARDIAGLSAGAYGAINVTLHHLDVFGNVQVWSGYFTETKTGVFAHASKADLAYNSPIDYVRTLRSALALYPLRAFLFVGRDDEASSQIVPMADEMKAMGADIDYAIYAGGHDWQVWNAHLNQMLILASHDMTRRVVPASVFGRPGLLASPRGHLAKRTHRAHVAKRRGRHAQGHRRTAPAVPLVSAGGPPLTLSDNPPRAPSPGTVIGGLLLALISAAAINLGFLLQHRGLREMPANLRGARARVRAVLHSRSWLGGQALGWAGFAMQILAVSIAPLSLVQSFAAGGLALSVPLAAGLFGYRISRRQLSAVLLVALALATLPIGLPRVVDRVHTSALVYSSIAAILIAGLLMLARRPATRAAAAGLLYGVADAAIKAVSVGWKGEGSSALISGWTALAVLATFGGFLAFQASLRAGDAIAAISLMTALAALVALGTGVVGFGESLGSTPVGVLGRVLSIGAVLGCVPVLAAAHTEIGEAADRDRPRLRRAFWFAAAAGRPTRNRAAGG